MVLQSMQCIFASYNSIVGNEITRIGSKTFLNPLDKYVFHCLADTCLLHIQIPTVNNAMELGMSVWNNDSLIVI